MILILGALYADAKVSDIWENGFKAGYQFGYQQGLQQPPAVWQSTVSTGKIVGSSTGGAGCPVITRDN